MMTVILICRIDTGQPVEIYHTRGDANARIKLLDGGFDEYEAVEFEVNGREGVVENRQ